MVEIDTARLWFEEAGTGPGVVLVHGGLGDSRMWDGQFEPFAARFRTLRYDARRAGRSKSPAVFYSDVDDLKAVLDVQEIDCAALVGLSRGGAVTIDFALGHPDRVWALVLVVSGLRGYQAKAQQVTDEQMAEWQAAFKDRDLERITNVSLDIWARLGITDEIRRLCLENAESFFDHDDLLVLGDDTPAAERLEEIKAPTLVVTGDRDVAAINEIGDVLEARISGARRVRLDSDHYVPMRDPDAFNDVVLKFLDAVAPDTRVT